MITFVSLFLALTIGVHPVEVLTGGAVDEIEVFLDGRSVGVRQAPPWRLSCDFGRQLLPHELVAVARDAVGNEVGRARQWVNLPRPPAEVNITLIESDGGQPGRVQLSWTIVLGREPQRIEIFFDGQPLAFEEPDAIALPRYDPDQIHYLRAEVDFGDGFASVAELVFGGTYADRVETEITAVPLALAGRRREPTPEALTGWLVKDGSGLAVAAVDRGPADLVIVPDPGAHTLLQTMAGWFPDLIFGVDPHRRIEFVFPIAEQTRSSRSAYTLFPHSQKLVGADANLPEVLFHFTPPPTRGRPRLADAVAVAGVTAAASNRRRGVLLLLSTDSPDTSDITPAAARRYLEALRVPLFVWSLRRNLAAAQAWGPTELAEDHRGLEVASRKVVQTLERQRMAWVVGRHLPQQVTLAAKARGVRLAGVEGDR